MQLQGILKDKGSLADKTRRILIDCQEASPEDLLEILKSDGKLGWFIFKEGQNKIDENEIKDLPEVKPEFLNQKTLSERLRNVIWRYWEKKGKEGEFEDFRKKQMEGLIRQYKELLSHEPPKTN